MDVVHGQPRMLGMHNNEAEREVWAVPNLLIQCLGDEHAKLVKVIVLVMGLDVLHPLANDVIWHRSSILHTCALPRTYCTIDIAACALTVHENPER